MDSFFLVSVFVGYLVYFFIQKTKILKCLRHKRRFEYNFIEYVHI